MILIRMECQIGGIVDQGILSGRNLYKYMREIHALNVIMASWSMKKSKVLTIFFAQVVVTEKVEGLE